MKQTAVESIIKFCEQMANQDLNSHRGAYFNVITFCKNQSKKMEKDIESYKNRIRVLQNLNFKYREKLGISNEPIDAINPVYECTHENIQMKSSGIWKCKCGYINY
jgi:hypothetical protein